VVGRGKERCRFRSAGPAVTGAGRLKWASI